MSDEIARPKTVGVDAETRRRNALDYTAAVVERDVRRLGGKPPSQAQIREQARQAMLRADAKKEQP